MIVVIYTHALQLKLLCMIKHCLRNRAMLASSYVNPVKSTLSHTRRTFNSVLMNDELHPPAPSWTWVNRNSKNRWIAVIKTMVECCTMAIINSYAHQKWKGSTPHITATYLHERLKSNLNPLHTPHYCFTPQNTNLRRSLLLESVILSYSQTLSHSKK